MWKNAVCLHAYEKSLFPTDWLRARKRLAQLALGDTAHPSSDQPFLFYRICVILAQMRVLANIDQTTLASVKVGQTATIYIDALPNQPLSGRVKKIGMFATTVGNVVTVPVRIEIDKTTALLSPGWSATVEIVTTP